MGRVAKPGWYPTDDGGRRYWDGAGWTSKFDPPPLPEGTPAGWHQDRPGVRRWWSGNRWTEAWAADDGTFDAARRVGQAIIKVMLMGGLDQPIEQKILEAMVEYPPSRIVDLDVHFSTFGMPGTTAFALIEWQTG